MRTIGVWLIALVVVAGSRAAAAAPAGAVDPRLEQKVTVGVKATAFSDLCDRLHAETGIAFTAGPSVADEKVTLFCRERPLREVMQQLARPFGYTWLRSTLNAQRSAPNRPDPSMEHRAPSTKYRYELVQDLRSQLLEEELRGRDKNAALLAFTAR